MPILNVEHNNSSIQLEAPDLAAGLRVGLNFHRSLTISEDDYLLAISLIEELTVESMLKLRALLPGLKVTAHYLPLQDSSILDAK